MADIDAKTVMQLRKMTGAPMMDCKAALKEVGGDIDKARDVLRKKGLQTADAKADREASEGTVFSYVHHDGKLGVMAEVTCETDFVARNEDFQAFGKKLCLHIAAFSPRFLVKEEVDDAVLAKEREIVTDQTRQQMEGKSDEMISKAVDGRMSKFFSEYCLMEQPWIDDDKVSVETARKALISTIGENIQIRRFVRLKLGE